MIQQLTIFEVKDYLPEQSRFGTVAINDSVTDNCTKSVDDFCTDSVTDSNAQNCVVTESICTKFGCVEVYCTGGTSRGDKKYYRFTWRSGNRVKHRHIPGGNSDSMLAKKRAALVQCEIDAGRSPEEIVKFIKSWKGK